MKFNPKLTGGLAWAGLIVILAVPSADMLTKQNGGSAAAITSETDPTRTASVVIKEPVKVDVPTAPDPVDEYLKSGKKLPSYISDAPSDLAEQRPAPTVKLVVPEPTKTVGPKAPVEVASVEPPKTVVPPQPYPASMRPAPPVVTTASVERSPAIPGEAPLIIEDERAATSQNEPLILDEDLVARRDAAVARVLEDDFPSSDRVDGEMLEQWDSGSLAEYLERRGLMSGQAQIEVESDFDEDGFFLDEGPSSEPRRRVLRRVPPREFILF